MWSEPELSSWAGIENMENECPMRMAKKRKTSLYNIYYNYIIYYDSCVNEIWIIIQRTNLNVSLTYTLGLSDETHNIGLDLVRSVILLQLLNWLFIHNFSYKRSKWQSQNVWFMQLTALITKISNVRGSNLYWHKSDATAKLSVTDYRSFSFCLMKRIVMLHSP